MELRVRETESLGESARSVATEANAERFGFPHTPRGQRLLRTTSERQRSFAANAVDVQDVGTAALCVTHVELAQGLVGVEHFVEA